MFLHILRRLCGFLATIIIITNETIQQIFMCLLLCSPISSLIFPNKKIKKPYLWVKATQLWPMCHPLFCPPQWVTLWFRLWLHLWELEAAVQLEMPWELCPTAPVLTSACRRSCWPGSHWLCRQLSPGHSWADTGVRNGSCPQEQPRVETNLIGKAIILSHSPNGSLFFILWKSCWCVMTINLKSNAENYHPY